MKNFNFTDKKTTYTISVEEGGSGFGLGIRDYSYSILVKAKNKNTIKMSLWHYDKNCTDFNWEPNYKDISEVAYKSFLHLIIEAKKNSWRFSKSDLEDYYDCPNIEMIKNNKTIKIRFKYLDKNNKKSEKNIRFLL